MEKGKLPLRIICPGRVSRNETISARAHCFFNQVEGLYIAENVSFADLKQTLYFFVQEMFGTDVKVRFRPSARRASLWVAAGVFGWGCLAKRRAALGRLRDRFFGKLSQTSE